MRAFVLGVSTAREKLWLGASFKAELQGDLNESYIGLRPTTGFFDFSTHHLCGFTNLWTAGICDWY